MTTKTLDDIKLDMSQLYEELRTGNVELKIASELANIAGKFLKAEQLQLAREIFVTEHPPVLPLVKHGNGATSDAHDSPQH